MTNKAILIMGLSKAEHMLDEEFGNIKLLYAGPRFDNDERHYKTNEEPYANEVLKYFKQLNYEILGIALYSDIYSIYKFRPIIKGVKIPITCIVGDTHHGKGAITGLAKWLHKSGVSNIVLKQTVHHRSVFQKLGFKVACLPHYAHDCTYLDPNENYIERMIFVGSLSKLHNKRKQYIKNLRERGIQLDCTTLPRSNTFKAYNLYACSFNMPLNGDLNYRIWEIMSAGGLCLTEEIPQDVQDMSYAKDKITLVTYRGVDDCYQKATKIIEDKVWRMSLARRANETIRKSKRSSENLKIIIDTFVRQMRMQTLLPTKNNLINGYKHAVKYEHDQQERLSNKTHGEEY